GAILIAGQHPFAVSSFEFQQYREFRGTFLALPYPALAIPGEGLPWLLVGPGKHGAGNLGELDGREVRLKGERIFRGEDHMIELLPGSLSVGGAGHPTDVVSDLGQVQMTGEIVDSKCYFGVMNPGNGKVHRDCAVRCISGGIPPALLVRDGDGRIMTLLLANWKHELLEHIAEPVTIRGHLKRADGRYTLYAE
ncbi:MAG TPA: hypothetical protein VGH38_33510, partial [Bryobacteraceae bacterium]